MTLKTQSEVAEIDAAKAASSSEIRSQESYFNTFASFAEVPDSLKKDGTGLIRESMFANQYDDSIKAELQSKCLRVMPHHQNTSGFFITIFEKLEAFGPESVETLAAEQIPAKDVQKASKGVIQELSADKASEFLRADPDDPDVQYIKAYYGLSDDFPTDQLISHNREMKKVYFISKEVSEYLYRDAQNHRLNIVSLGVLLLQRNVSKYSAAECIFRVAQDGIMNLVPHMTKRIVRTKNLEILKQFIMSRYSAFEALPDE